MSKFEQVETTFTDPNHLCAALTEMGFIPDMHLDQPVNLVGYHGDERPEVAHIVIRRHQIGAASNDVGFVRQENGVFKAIISQFDSHRFNAAWNTKLADTYQERKAMAVAKQKGYRFLGKTLVNGKTQLRFEVQR